jgi:hypothetical protein
MSMYAIRIDRLDFDPEKLSFHLDLVDNEDNDLTNRIATGQDIQVVGRRKTLTFYHVRSKQLFLNGMLTQLFDTTYKVKPNQVDQPYIINFRIKWTSREAEAY